MTLTAPCDWPTANCPTCDDSCLSPTQQDDVTAWVISELWEATGRVFGTCPVSVLPCNSSVCGLCRNRLRDCGCRSVPEIRLAGPVASVTDVVIDGVSLDPLDYRIDDYEWLVRLDGGSWPSGSDPVDPDSFRVDYNLGVVPPAGAGIVTGILVCSRSNCPNTTCKVARDATQVSRQGVTMIRGNASSNSSRPWRYYPDTVGIFGIREVDQWVRNANAPTLVGAVHSPDICVPRQITWEAPVSP